MQNNIFRIALVTLAILMIPFLGMQISTEWNWGLLDFIVMGALIFGTGLMLNLTFSRVESTNKQIFIGILIVLAFLLIWTELAVDAVSQLLALIF